MIKGDGNCITKLLIKDNPYYRSVFGYSDKFWKQVTSGLQVVNLGSNTGLYGFRYDGLDIKAANWAMSPQSFNQDLAILKSYFSYLGPHATIIVPIGPFSSCLKHYTDAEWLKYYTILHPGVMENFSKERRDEAYRLKDQPLKYARKPMIKGVLQKLKNKVRGVKDPLELDYQPMTDGEIEQNAQAFIDGWKNQFKIDDMDASLPPHIIEGRKKRVETLKEMYRFCLSSELRMVIVLPPITKALSDRFSETFRENYLFSFLREAGIPNDVFLNYLEDKELSKPEHFVNSMFLNNKGGRLFTRRVLSELNIIS